MPFLRIFLAVCLFVSQAHAGSLTLLGAGKPAAIAGGCSQATTFLTAAAGTTHSTAYTTLICNLVSQGVLAKLDGLYIFATDTHTIADINLIQPGTFNLTEHTSPTFTADQGFTGNTSTAPYLDTSFTPGVSTGSFALNSASIGIWTRIAPSGTTGSYSGALYAGTANGAWISNGAFSTTGIGTGVNITFGGDDITATGTGVGLSVGNRSASNANQLYHNGSSVGTSSTASTSLASATSLFFLSRDNGGAPNQASDEQMAAAVFGGNLNLTDQGNLCHEIGAYLFSIGSIGSNPC